MENNDDVYDLYRRGVALLAAGSPAAAALLLRRALDAQPDADSLAEALGRAHYDAGQYEQARDVFFAWVERRPSADYGHFGAGLALTRLGDLPRAVDHLALAAVMRPENGHYQRALRRARVLAAA